MGEVERSAVGARGLYEGEMIAGFDGYIGRSDVRGREGEYTIRIGWWGDERWERCLVGAVEKGSRQAVRDPIARYRSCITFLLLTGQPASPHCCPRR